MSDHQSTSSIPSSTTSISIPQQSSSTSSTTKVTYPTTTSSVSDQTGSTIESSIVPTSLPTSSTKISTTSQESVETSSSTTLVSSSSTATQSNCPVGLIEVEDGSCVPPTFFEIEPHPNVDIGTPPFPITTVIPYVPINGPGGVNGLEPAIRETTSIVHEPYNIPVLPATGGGLEVTIPLIIGAIITPVGFWLRKFSTKGVR